MSKKLTLEEFTSKLNYKTQEAIEILKFDGGSKPITFRILKTGEIRTQSPASGLFKNTSGTFKPQGRIPSNKNSIQDIQREIDLKFGKNTLEVLEYNSRITPMVVRCTRCGVEKTYANAAALKSIDFGCQSCDRPNMTKEETQIEIDSLFGQGEFLILEYSRREQPITIKHKCGFIMKKRGFSKIKNMLGCPQCEKSQSKGARDIAGYLLKLGIPFETEFSFSDLRGKKFPLRFDFAVKKDNQLFCLIEFDGEGHYLKNSRYYSEDLIQADAAKNRYCSEHQIPLLRIPYWEFKRINKLILDFLTLNDYPFGEYDLSRSETLDP